MTEMSGVFSVLGPADHRDAAHPERLLSAGRPVAGAEVRVVDPTTGKDLGPGEVGEFWVLSDQHIAGYWAKPEATAEPLLPDGWLRPGDAGYQHEAGYRHISARGTGMIISGGRHV